MSRIAPLISGWQRNMRNTPGPLQGASLRGGVFLPDSMPNARQIVEIAFGADLTADPATWPWVDVTSLVLWDPGVSISPMGPVDEFQEPAPAQCSFTLKNLTGDFTQGNGRSIYWPNVKLNTPIRCSLDMGSGAQVRFQGECSNGFETRWDTTRNYVVCDVVAAGVGRRIGQGNSPLKTALFRAMTGVQPLAAWSLDDPQSATQATATVGGSALLLSGATLGNDPTTLTGTTAVAELAQLGTLAGNINAYQPTNFFAFRQWVRLAVPGTATPNGITALDIRSSGSGTIRSIGLVLFGTGIPPVGCSVALWNGVSVWVADTGLGIPGLPINPLDGNWHEVFCSIRTVGTTLTMDVYLDGQLGAHVTGITETLNTATSFIVYNNQAAVTTSAMQYSTLALYTDSSAVPAYGAGNAWTGETVSHRLLRLGAEEDIAMDIVGTADAKVGPQLPDTLSNLFKECAKVDGGLLLDGLNAGYTLFSQSCIINRPADLLLDASADQIQPDFKPAPGDYGHVNEFTATRRNGGSYVARDLTSPQGLGPNGVGKYDSSGSFNVVDDGAMLRTKAELPVNLGTVSEPRFPTLTLEMAKPSLAALRQSWLTLRPFSRIDIVNAANVFGTTWPPIQLVLQGYSEHWNSKLWSFVCNCSPYAPWRVATLSKQSVVSPPTGSENVFRLQGEHSRTSGAVAAGASTITVATDAGFQLWSTTATYPNDFPFYALIQDQRVLVTGIAGASSPQTFTVDPSTVVYGIRDGASVRVWHAARLGPANLT